MKHRSCPFSSSFDIDCASSGIPKFHRHRVQYWDLTDRARGLAIMDYSDICSCQFDPYTPGNSLDEDTLQRNSVSIP